MGPFDLVVFDCDGVLVDSELLSCQWVADLLSRYGLPIGLDGVLERFLGRPPVAIETYYYEQSGTPLPARFRDELRDGLEAVFRQSLKPTPHVAETIGALRCPYCLASSSNLERIRLALAVTGLDVLFKDRVFNTAMVERAKPAPDLFLFAAARMGVAPERVLVVEDSEIGVMAGKAAGMTVLGYIGGSHHTRPDAAQRLTEAGADRILTTMSDFPLR